MTSQPCSVRPTWRSPSTCSSETPLNVRAHFAPASMMSDRVRVDGARITNEASSIACWSAPAQCSPLASSQSDRRPRTHCPGNPGCQEHVPWCDVSWWSPSALKSRRAGRPGSLHPASGPVNGLCRPLLDLLVARHKEIAQRNLLGTKRRFAWQPRNQRGVDAVSGRSCLALLPGRAQRRSGGLPRRGR
jgi:hypothetical protein